MARTVVAIYDEFQTANNAVRELVENGFARDSISIVANTASGEYGTPEAASTATGENVAGETGAGAGAGAGIGAAIGGIGGLLVGLGALVIPGIGPVLAAGPLAVALSTLTGAGVGAVAGGVTGGLLGALIGLGIPEEEAEFYTEGVRRGGVLVTVQSEEYNTDQIMNTLNSHHPADINEQAEEWRSQGWKGHDTADTTAAAAVDASAPTLMPPTTPHDQQWRVEGSQDFDLENPAYRSHYDTYLASSGYPFDYYAPAYQYGYGVAGNARYQNNTWAVIEPEVKNDWEREHPGTWNRFSVAIRHAWENITN